MIVVVTRPKTYIGEYSGSKFSRWNALHNPIRYTLQRRDYEVLSVGIDGTVHTTKPTVLIDATSGEVGVLTAGDTIYIDAGPYTGNYEVLLISGSKIVLDTAFIGNAINGFINFVNYFNEHYIQVVAFNNDVNYGTWRGTADSTGLITVDISSFLKKYLDIKDESDFVLRNVKQDDSFGNWLITYTEFGGTTPGTNIDSEGFYFTNSAKQIQELYSGNMAEYVPFKADVEEAKKMKFLNDGRPTYFVGYPFDLYWIYPDGFEETEIERHQQNYDLNGATTSAESNLTLFSSEKEGVNTLVTSVMDSNNSYFDIWLELGGEITGGGYVAEGYVLINYVSADAIPA